MNVEILTAIGLEALFQDQRRGAFVATGRFMTRPEFMRGGFPVILNPIAVLACARAGMNVVQIDPPKVAAAPAPANGKVIQLAR